MDAPQPPRTLTRTQFEKACKLYISGESSSLLSYSPPLPQDTSLDEMSLVEIDDQSEDGTLSFSAPRQTIVIEQSVIYSATYQVPGFAFTAHDKGGNPLSITELASTSFLRHRSSVPASTVSDVQSVVISPRTADDAPFPLLSAADHPVLGTPCWAVHPCETSSAMGELLDDVIRRSWDEDDAENGLARWMALWFMLLGTIVDLGPTAVV
ncbi:hypothetical protein DL93DRAFT_2053043 [Clavulina sp. PMI_390]|nr:hypothetical protein DL93DRAFT_2053043 [Clavulina sp. PMI_390]